MIFCSNNIFTFFKQCFHCKRISYKEPICSNKYLHKKKEFKVTKKKKNEKSNKFNDNFSDNFTLNLNLTFNSIFKLFLNMKFSASTLSFMLIVSQYSLSVWIIDTKTLDHLCFTWKFFFSYQSIVWLLKMVNEPA